MKHFYTQLLATFKKEENQNLFKKVGLPPIHHIDLYAGQDTDPSLKEIYRLPALFINWNIDYTPNQAIVTMDFRIAYEQLRDSSNYTKTNSFAFLEFPKITDQIINSFTNEDTGRLHLQSEAIEIEPTVVDVYTLSYKALYFFNASKKKSPHKNGLIDNLNIDF